MEKVEFKPFGPVDNGKQTLFGLDYRMAAWRHGEEDQNPTVAQSEELKSRAQRAGKDVTIKVYRNAGHAFLADYRPSYREGPAQELWGDAVACFARHLKS